MSMNESTPSGCAAVAALPITPERADGILTQLALPMETLTEQESGELKTLSNEFADVFALKDTELDCTDLTTYGIDTGDHRATIPHLSGAQGDGIRDDQTDG